MNRGFTILSALSLQALAAAAAFLIASFPSPQFHVTVEWSDCGNAVQVHTSAVGWAQGMLCQSDERMTCKGAEARDLDSLKEQLRAFGAPGTRPSRWTQSLPALFLGPHFPSVISSSSASDQTSLLRVMIAAAALPVLWMVMWLRRRVQKKRQETLGLCLVCNYDLRASSQRCPECGTPITLNAQAR
jgi:hypothetical protein